MSTNKMKIDLGTYSMEIDESILSRLAVLKECEYMVDDLTAIIERIIELFQGQYDFGDIISAQDSMVFINTLHAAKKDYAFLATLNIEKSSVFEQANEDS